VTVILYCGLVGCDTVVHSYQCLEEPDVSIFSIIFTYSTLRTTTNLVFFTFTASMCVIFQISEQIGHLPGDARCVAAATGWSAA
jgi:hypothetical protein